MDTNRAESDRIQALEQSLIDERAARDEAQRRANELEDRVSIWRTRAEERAARIAKLEDERARRSSLSGRMRAGVSSFRPGRPGASDDTPDHDEGPASMPAVRLARRLPGTSIAHNVTGRYAAVLDQAGAVDLESRPWNAVDLVAIDADTFQDADRLDAWLALDVRPPTVVFTGDAVRWAAADAVVRSHADPGTALPEPILAAGDTPPSIDPSSGVIVTNTDGQATGILATLGPATPGDVATAAALGVPVAPSEAELHEPGAGTRSRRWAWEHRDPAIVLGQLLDRVGVTHKPIAPTVAGVLVSNRPDRVDQAVAGFMGQRYRNKELVVGCHGFDSQPVRSLVEQRGWADAVRILEFPDRITLGSCTNEAASASSASVLAKIDDDDHYGPEYLTDAVLALRYSGAEVVGKAAQFTYVESIDRTVLRRGGTEETLVSGVLTGATLVFKRDIWDDVRFPDRPRMIDVHFLNGVRAAGASVYANSRWEFVYRRSPGGHTWDIDDDRLVEGSEPAWDGWHPERTHL